MCKNQGLKLEKVSANVGDLIIWHPELPHGGSKILNRGNTRHSLVCHYMPDGAYVQKIDYFFGLEEKSKIMSYSSKQINNRRMRSGETVFASNK